jgi:hypothetical protein
MGLAAARCRYGHNSHRYDPHGRDGWLADAAGKVEHRLCVADVLHVVGNDGRDDAPECRADAAVVRPRQWTEQISRCTSHLERSAAGYLLVWGGFSAVAVALQWALETTRLLSPMLETSTVWLGADILIAAGLWQLSPMKGVCLRHCRTPLGFLISHWRPGNGGVFRMGLEHGAWCLWLLLGTDYVALFWRGDEPLLDHRAGNLRTSGENHSPRPMVWSGPRHRAGRLGHAVIDVSAEFTLTSTDQVQK